MLMTVDRMRRVLALVLALALVAGLATYDAHASSMNRQMVTATACDMSMPGGCNGCGDDRGMPSGACFTFCGGVIALLPSGVTETIATSVTPPPGPVASMSGRAGSPDPYPPKSSVLS